MKKLLACGLIVAIAAMCLPAYAVHPSELDDMSWWGNTADPEPVPDPRGRTGYYWWWPTEPDSNAGDQELWGNRGIVYNAWTKPAPPAPPVARPPTGEPQVQARRPVSNTILFDFDKSVVKPEGQQALNEIVAELKRFPNDTITVEGHTCDIGTNEYNQGLSERRAKAVVDYLTSQGIAASRIQSEGYGETRPAVENSSAANRRLNRRAYFVTQITQ